MPKWLRCIAFFLGLVFTMALGMLLLPLGSSASHNPIALAVTEATRQAERAAQVDDHGHAHDDGLTDEQGPGHAHGHNPGDHTHGTASAAPDFVQFVFPAGRMWHAHRPSFECRESDVRLERLPRSIVLA